METITEEPMMPMPMTRPDPLTGSGRDQSARLLDDGDVDRLVAQAEGDEPDEDEDEEGQEEQPT